MNKLICIFLCILLICLSICPIFATMDHFSGGSGTQDDPFTYDNLEDFCQDCPLFSTSIVKTNQGAEPYIDNALEYFGLDGLTTAIHVDNMGITLIPFSSIVSFTGQNSGTFTNTSRYWALYNSNGVMTNHVSYNQQSLALSSNQLPYYYIQSIPDMQYAGVYVSSAPPTPPDPTERPNYNYPSYNPYVPTSPTGWDNFMEFMAGIAYDNFRFTCNNTIYNDQWMSVGEYLTYDFLCKNNPDLETVSFNDYEYNNYIKPNI